MEEPAWKQNVVFPMIARIIHEACDHTGGYISAHGVASRLSQDAEAQVIIEEAQRQLGDTQPHGSVATNMVSWFSSRIAGRRSEWEREFSRVLVDGEWAYKPKG